MRKPFRIAYWLRTDPQHWEHVKSVYQRLGGFVITKNPGIYEYLKESRLLPEEDLILVRNSSQARAFLFRNKIKIVVYTGFQHIFWGYSVQVFHGSSDKDYLLSGNRVLLYDLLLLPGRKHLRKITSTYHLKDESRLKLVGYPKFDRLVNGEITGKPLFDNGKPVVLYAPTWISQNSGSKLVFSPHGESSLLLWGENLIKAIGQRWNLIIKYHSRINPNERSIYERIDRCIEDAGVRHSVKTVWDSSVVEYMNQADIMISDISAVCYEWMHTGRPIVFANPSPENYRPSDDPMSNTYAWQAGDVLYKEEDIVPTIEKNLAEDRYAETRLRLLEETFFSPDGKAGERQAAEIVALYDRVKNKPFPMLFLHNVMVYLRDSWRYIKLRLHGR